MNKIKIILALAVIASTVLLASAFTSTNRPVPSRSSVVWDDTLFWFQPSGASLSYDAYLLREDEVDHSDCPDEGSVECRKGYGRDQLNNPANPSLGVKSTQINNPQDIIYKIVP